MKEHYIIKERFHRTNLLQKFNTEGHIDLGHEWGAQKIQGRR